MTVLKMQALAHYQRSGDGPADVWARHRLDWATTSSDILLGGDVVGEWQACWVQVVVFTFEFAVTAGCDDGAEYLVTQALATSLAEHIVGEADVQVLGLKLLDWPEDEPVNALDSSRNAEGSHA